MMTAITSAQASDLARKLVERVRVILEPLGWRVWFDMVESFPGDPNKTTAKVTASIVNRLEGHPQYGQCLRVVRSVTCELLAQAMPPPPTLEYQPPAGYAGPPPKPRGDTFEMIAHVVLAEDIVVAAVRFLTGIDQNDPVPEWHSP